MLWARLVHLLSVTLALSQPPSHSGRSPRATALLDQPGVSFWDTTVIFANNQYQTSPPGRIGFLCQDAESGFSQLKCYSMNLRKRSEMSALSENTYEHALRLQEALEKAGVAHQLVTLHNGKHGNFTRKTTFGSTRKCDSSWPSTT